MIQLHHGDALDVLRGLASESVDAIVTDPPAGINFMQKEFDSDRGGRAQWVAWLAAIMREALRVLKPGGRALVWAIPRTSHWTACAIEDAGFLVENRLAHFFGSGFPKGKSQLKPAVEDWWLCRKPGGKAPALNVDACRVGFSSSADEHEAKEKNRHGDFGSAPPARVAFGADNREGSNYNAPGRWPPNLLLSHSDECERVGERRVQPANGSGIARKGNLDGHTYNAHGDWGLKARAGADVTHADPDGKETVADWRCVPGCPVRALDLQSGERVTGPRIRHKQTPRADGWGNIGGIVGEVQGHTDTGTASRFFPQFAPDPLDDVTPFLYAAKASRRERNAGCAGLPAKLLGTWGGEDDDLSDGKKPTIARANVHPTVKPQALMRWLARLITPPAGTVLDPFMGSGSTGVACVAEGFGFIGIEREAEYLAIARARIEHAEAQRKPQQAALAI